MRLAGESASKDVAVRLMGFNKINALLGLVPLP
jgi:hypothetical protein